MEIFISQRHFKHVLPTLFLIFIFITSYSSADPISDALLTLKSELIDTSNSLQDWSMSRGKNPPGRIHACSWSGVTCNQNSTTVTGLDLSMKYLAGELSPNQFSLLTNLITLNISYNSFSQKLPIGIFNLTKLETLDISRNNFSGQFPNGISKLQNLMVFDAFSNSFSGNLPNGVSELKKLKVLNFAGSYFSGPIPSTYGNLTSLEFIHLAGNFLTGELPTQLGNLKSVTHMEIGYNNYNSEIPFQFAEMDQLQYLDIAGANLSGSIPSQLSNLAKLHTLFLFRNHLSGLIPWEIGKIKPLTSLDLSDNHLSGPIPESFSELKSLRLLSLMYNEMSGVFPQELAKLPQLDTLLIWNNFFSGSLPNELGKYSDLKWVDVSTNNFSGEIPGSICERGVLEKLIMFSNSFSGRLVHSLSNCSSLVRVRIENNQFSGEVPFKFSNLKEIQYVDLSRNRFTGGVPNDIFKASKLEYFNVSGNKELGGVIPAKTWYLPVIQNFSASSCNISGHIPPLKSCKSLSVVELAMNHLSGTFPKSVANCESLERMNLANNDLSGHIPEELADLPSLVVLDLSRNNFSGLIPPKFVNSTSLRLLNVSFNDFSGSIPSEKVFRLMGRSAFFGNPKLCGAPLRDCGDGEKISSGLKLGSKRTQKVAWVLILCAVVVLFITISVFGVFYFRRGRKGQWKMVSFNGFPPFTPNDVLRSFNSPLSGSVCKAVLPTGITVLVRKIELEAKRMDFVLGFVNRMGNARHKNLIRLLGFCYNNDLAYLLYDYLPNGNLAEKMIVKRDWEAKCKIVIGIARGLCFLHHDCYPAIPHGNLKASNVVFDENMEPHLAEFGFKSLVQLSNCSSAATMSMMETGELNTTIKEEISMDVYNFGEILLEILTNGRLKNGGERVHCNPKDALLREIYNENEAGSSKSFQDEIKQVVEVALLCTRSRSSERASMEDALKLLPVSKSQQK